MYSDWIRSGELGRVKGGEGYFEGGRAFALCITW